VIWAQGTSDKGSCHDYELKPEVFFGMYQSKYCEYAQVSSLFRIIRCVSEDSRIKTADNAITTLNNDAVLVSINERIIEEGLPLRVKGLTMTVGH
jgi:hypothetical protein